MYVLPERFRPVRPSSVAYMAAEAGKRVQNQKTPARRSLFDAIDQGSMNCHLFEHSSKHWYARARSCTCIANSHIVHARVCVHMNTHLPTESGL